MRANTITLHPAGAPVAIIGTRPCVENQWPELTRMRPGRPYIRRGAIHHSYPEWSTGRYRTWYNITADNYTWDEVDLLTHRPPRVTLVPVTSNLQATLPNSGIHLWPPVMRDAVMMVTSPLLPPDSYGPMIKRGLGIRQGRLVPDEPAPLSDALAAIAKALKVVNALCQGDARWTMSVPARPDSDPDLVISNALRLARDELEGRKS